jgi:lipopolysaccharide export system protein LptC
LTTLAPLDERDVSAIALPRDGERDLAFRRAKRHSRRVRFLRIALPGCLLLAVVAALALSRLDPLRMLTKLPIDVGSVVISGTKITMQQPRIAGFTRDSRSYELTAKAAAQDVTKPDTIELQGLYGTSEMSDRTVLTLTADNGIYDSKTEMLTLHQNVMFKSSAGLTVLLSDAVIDTRGGGIVSEKRVEVKFSQGIVNASRMEVANSGEVIRFEGDVVMTLKSAGQVMHLGGVP